METNELVAKIQELTDLELAILLSLTASQHCLIETEPEAIESLSQELQIIASNVFGLSHAVTHCSGTSTVKDLLDDILVEGPKDTTKEIASVGRRSPGRGKRQGFSTASASNGDNLGFPNVIIFGNLNVANHETQIQVLELIRTRRMLTHSGLVTAPKAFVVVVVVSTPGKRLNEHLNDHLFISHYHDSEDGFKNLEEGSEWIDDDRASLDSVVRRSVAYSEHRKAVFSQGDIHTLIELSKKVTVTAEIKAYLQNIVTFLRLHRAVSSGVSPRATHHFDILIRALAPPHGLTYVTPSLVSLAARKIYGHRINICSPENERSMQYGSDLKAVAMLLEDITAADVIEQVIAAVEVPL